MTETQINLILFAAWQFVSVAFGAMLTYRGMRGQAPIPGPGSLSQLYRMLRLGDPDPKTKKILEEGDQKLDTERYSATRMPGGGDRPVP